MSPQLNSLSIHGNIVLSKFTLYDAQYPDVTFLQLKIIFLKFTFDPVPALLRQALLQTKLTCDSNPGWNVSVVM
jgi:hypothetical protein